MSPVDSDEEEDLTRKQRREQARAQRTALEQAEAASATRRRRLIRVGGIVVAAIVVAGVLIAATSGGSSHKASAKTGSSEGALLETPAPWAPQDAGLQARVQAFGFPPQSDTGYHVHAVLRIYVEGKQVTVPAKVGILASEEFLAPLHTHDTTGIIHIESSEPYPFKLGQFFTIWGVKFTNTQLGGYVAGNGNVLSVYVNGKLMPSPVEYVMNAHDQIVVGYGKPGSFPTSFQYTFPAGL